jgi:hypothetical protein
MLFNVPSFISFQIANAEGVGIDDVLAARRHPGHIPGLGRFAESGVDAVA